MRTTFVCAMLVFLGCGLGVAFEGFSQIPPTELNKNIKTIPLKLPTKDIEKVKAALPSVGVDAKKLVQSLVQHYELDQEEKTKKNPNLVFGPNEIKYWTDKHLDRQTLKLEFAARRLILDAANEQNVAIRDQGMLSAAAREVIPWLQGPSRPSPTATPQTTVIQERQKDQTLDVACIICGCQPGGDISKDLIEKAWGALNANQGGMNPKNFEKALACTKVTIIRFAGDADEQQAARLQTGDCKKTPTKEEKERDAYFASYWALSDIAAAWFIRGQAFEQQRNCAEAREAYQTIIARYNCAYIWDPRGWFWNAAKGADQALKNLEANGCTGRVR